jgi:hypothetical protein
MLCWYCERETGLSETDYGDHKCPRCLVLISIYNPSDIKTEEEMKPPKHENKEFEKVVVGEMIPGIIQEINYDKEHKFKGFQGKEDTIQTGVRFKFHLEGCQHPHYSRWMKFSYAEKANLYKIFIAKLVENPAPDMDLDLDLLKGMKVKTLWNGNGEYQNLESIFPAGAKVKATDPLPTEEPTEEVVDEP